MTERYGDFWVEEFEEEFEAPYMDSQLDLDRTQEVMGRELDKLETELAALLNRRSAISRLQWEGVNSAWDFILLRENDALTNCRDLLPPDSPLSLHSISLEQGQAAMAEQYYNYSLGDGMLYWNENMIRTQSRMAPVDVKGFAFTPRIYFNIDGFSGAWLVWHALHGKFLPLLITAVVSAISAILLMVWLFSSSGYTGDSAADGSRTIRLKLAWFDYIPFDLLLFLFPVLPLLALSGSQILWHFSTRLIPFETANVSTLSQIYDETTADELLRRFGTLAFFVLFIAVLMFGILLLSLIRRLKLHRFLRTTICGALILLLIRGIVPAGGPLALATVPACCWLPLLIFSVLIAILILAAGHSSFFMPVLLYVLAGFLLLLHLYRRQLDNRDHFAASTSALAAGDIEVQMKAPGCAGLG